MRVPHFPGGKAFKEIGRNAYVDWIVVLIASFITFFVLVGGGVHLYWKISSGNFKIAEVKTQQEKIFDKEELDALVKHFQIREEMSVQIKKGYRGPADPSR